MKPLALDFYCKAGGNARGLVAAGFDVVGVDIEPQPNYPYRFVQGNALSVLEYLLSGRSLLARKSTQRMKDEQARYYKLEEFDYIWASPPCLDNTALRHAPKAKRHQDLIAPTRKLLKQTDLPWTIENVDSARARARMRSPIMLCGTMFDLGTNLRVPISGGITERRWFDLQRHRLFESNFPVQQPHYSAKKLCVHNHPAIGVYGSHARVRAASAGGRGTSWPFPTTSQADAAARALGLPKDCMTLEEFGNAIPPVYAMWIAAHALEDIGLRFEAKKLVRAGWG